MTELEELKKQKICHLKLEVPLEELKRLMEFWFNNPDSDYNIEKNFDALQQKHERYLALVDEFVQTKLNLPSTLENLQKELARLAQSQNELAKTLGDVVLADASFCYSLDILIKALRQNEVVIESIAKEFFNLWSVDIPIWESLEELRSEGKSEIKIREIEHIVSLSDYPELEPSIRAILKSIRSWIGKAVYLKTFILEANRKRSLVFEIARGKIELYLESEFAKLSGQKLEDLKDQIDAILAARDLLIEIENWWFNAEVLNGFGGGYLFKYLQFEKPLLIMRSDYAQGLSFEERIDALSSLPPATKAVLKNELQTRLNMLKVEIDKLVSGGWQPLLERQKLLVEARVKKGGILSSDCKAAIAEFEGKASNVQTLFDFRITEEAFKKHIDACSVPTS